MGKIITQKGWGQKRNIAAAIANEKATEQQWELARMAIDAFIAEYPREWMVFQRQLADGRSEYNVATEGDLKKANFRNTGAFPVYYAREEDGSLRQVDALLPVLEKIIPQLTKKESKNYREFLRRFPVFQVPEKL